MKKIIIAVVVILILSLLNYSLYPVVFPESPTYFDEDSEIVQISQNDMYNHREFEDLEVFGMGYALLSSNRASPDIYLNYYDFSHDLIWQRNLNRTLSSDTEVIGSDEYLSIYSYFGSSLYTHTDTVNGTEEVIHYIETRSAKARIYNLYGDVISYFSLQLTNVTEQLLANYLTMTTRAISATIYVDSFFLLERTEFEYLNSTFATALFLHSYDILTGEVNWIQQIDLIEGRDHYFSIVEHQQMSKDIQSIIISSQEESVLLHRYIIEFDGSGSVSDITREIKSYGCLGNCWYAMVLSFDEVISYTQTYFEEKSIHTYTSSRGYDLNITVANITSPNPDWIQASYMDLYGGIKLNDNTIALRGFIEIKSHYYNNLFGFLTSDDRLELILMDMNQTRIGFITPVDDSTFLSTLTDHPSNTYQVVVWSITRIQLVNDLYPLEKNYFPVIMILSLIVYYISKGIDSLRSRYTTRDSDI